MNKRTILEVFAKETLGYERTGKALLDALEAILAAIDRANRNLAVLQINQEDGRFGTPNVIRGLQERLYAAGYIHRIIKRRGEFTSIAYVYNPYTFIQQSGYYDITPVSPQDILELDNRLSEGEAKTQDYPLAYDDLEWVY